MRLRWLSTGFLLAIVVMLVLGYLPRALGKGLAFTGVLAPAAPAAPAAPQAAMASPPQVSPPSSPASAVPAAPGVTPAACSTAPVVDCATGAFTPQFTDLSVPGRGIPLAFIRSYSSALSGTSAELGPGWTDNYDISLSNGAGGAVTVSLQATTWTFTAAAGGGFTAPAGTFATLTANPSPPGGYTLRLDRARVTLTFSAAGQLTAETDANGNRTRLTYSAGLLRAVTDPSGRRLTFGYSGTRLIQVSDPLGRVTSYGFDVAGNLASVTDAMERTWSFGYDTGSRLDKLTDPDGGLTTVRYRPDGRVSGLTDPLGGTTTWGYQGRPATGTGSVLVTDPDKDEALFSYEAGLLASATVGFGTSTAATTSYAYVKGTAQVASIVDADGNRATFSYDADGDLKTAAEPGAADPVISYQYNSFGEVTGETTAPGEATTYTYDPAGNLLSATDPTGNETTYGYGGRPGEITSVASPDGDTTIYGYDDAGDIDSVTVTPQPGEGDMTAYAYDADGELTCLASARATAAGVTCGAPGTRVTKTTTARYDAAGEVTSVSDPDGRVTSYAYDADGDEMQVVNPDGDVTTYAYDADGRLTAVTNPENGIETTRYDLDGRVTAQVTPEGQVTTYAYDAQGQVSAETSPLGQVTGFAYDGDGNRTMLTEPSSALTYYAYYPGGALKSAGYFGPGAATPAVSYTYYPDGSRKSMTDGTGTTTYGYNLAGLLTEVTDGAGETVGYTYVRGQLAAISYPGGEQVSRSYDGAGQLTAVTDWLGNTVQFSYDADGNLTGEQLPGGVTQTSGYDPADELTAITDTAGGRAVASFSYTRGSLGQVTSVTSAGTGQGPQDYSYTPAGQLASVNGAPYGYDADGDLTQLPGGEALAYNAGGELTTLTHPPAQQAAAGVTSYGYDPDGSRLSSTSDGQAADALTYNQAGELTGYTGAAPGGIAATVASYAYNGDGLRTSKTVNGQATEFTWEQSGPVPLLIAAGGTSYVDGPGGQPAEQVTGTTATFLLADQQGSIRLLASADGKVAGTYSYDPYGTVTSYQGTVTSAMQFDGEYSDAETGLQYLQARYYDPATGQFVGVDPDVSLTAQAYAYAGGNPLNAIDPTGLSWWNPFSWHRVWHDIAVTAHAVVTIAKDVKGAAAVIGLAATGIALCAATACLGDLAFLGIDAAAFYAAAWSGANVAEFIAGGTALTADAVIPAAQKVEIFANAMSTAGYCGSDLGSGSCHKSASDLASSVSDYYIDKLSDHRGGPGGGGGPDDGDDGED